MRHAADTLTHWYRTLSPATLPEIERLYCPDAYFKDPFHEFSDRARLEAVYRRMFQYLENPHFLIEECVMDGAQAVLIWRFRFGYRGRALGIRGSSHLRFAADGRVSYHRDYWDAGEEVYEKLPLLGGLLRLVKKRVG